MNDFERRSEYEWIWQVGSKFQSVRYFAKTNRLIWSGWINTENGPAFDTGVAQTVDDFLTEGVSHITPPPALTESVRAYLLKQQHEASNTKYMGLFGFFRRKTP